MSSLLLRGRHWATSEPTEVLLSQGKIAAIRPITDTPADLTADWLAPAFFDLQINGGGGHRFTSQTLTVDDVRAVTHLCHQHGIAAYLATVITSSETTLLHAFQILRQARETDTALALAIPGFHLEGPYISPEDGPRGAHPRTHVRPPDWHEFQRLQEAAGGLIRLVTLAPETEGALAFIERLVQRGIVVALGHTAATPQQIRDAVSAGARLSTHLGNGCARQLPRHENVLWEQLATDDLFASLITDGHHLPWPLVKCFLRCKTPARIILTCDASPLAGLPQGRYDEWEQQFEILPEGKIILRSQGVLAGSWALTDLCLSRLVRQGGVSLREAIPMVTEHPGQLLRLPTPTLSVGESAAVTLFYTNPDGEVTLRATVLGETVWEAPG